MKKKLIQISDAFKMAWVGFAQEMKWDYSVKMSYGSSFSRKSGKVSYQSELYKFEDKK